MKCLRMVLMVSWTAKKTNEWVLKAAGLEKILLTSDKAAKMTYFEQILRKKRNCLEKEIIQMRHQVPELGADVDNMAGQYQDLDWRPVAHLIMTVEDRGKWRKIVSSASNPQFEDRWRRRRMSAVILVAHYLVTKMDHYNKYQTKDTHIQLHTQLLEAITWLDDHQGRLSVSTIGLHKLHIARCQVLI